MVTLKRRWACVSVGGTILFISLVSCTSGQPLVQELVLGEDGVTLEVGVASCNADVVVTAEEDVADVVLRVQITNDTDEDCQDSVLVVLDERLGDRQVIDAATGDVVPVRRGG